jgi:peroxiredoxin
MRLSAPAKAPKVLLRDINGDVIQVGEGRRTLLAFFRDAACPFCNMQVYRLTQHYASLHALGLDVVAVFASTPEEVRRFVLARPRPFPVAAEPDATAYEIYGIQKSFWRKLRAVLLHFGSLLGGLRRLGLAGAVKGMAGINTNNLMPADFLIDEQGYIAEAYYGRDAGDHIPFERVELFLARGLLQRGAAPSESGRAGAKPF